MLGAYVRFVIISLHWDPWWRENSLCNPPKPFNPSCAQVLTPSTLEGCCLDRFRWPRFDPVASHHRHTPIVHHTSSYGELISNQTIVCWICNTWDQSSCNHMQMYRYSININIHSLKIDWYNYQYQIIIA